MNTTLVTVELRCGHEREYDLATTPPPLRADVVSRLALVECVGCRRTHATRHGDDRESSSSLDSLGVGRDVTEHLSGYGPVALARLQGTEWAVVAGARVRFTVLSEAYEWCSEREWTEEEFAQRVVVPARQRRDAAWWLDHRDGAPWDLEEALTRVDAPFTLDGDVRGATDE